MKNVANPFLFTHIFHIGKLEITILICPTLFYLIETSIVYNRSCVGFANLSFRICNQKGLSISICNAEMEQP